MARISGVDLPREKRVEIGLTYIYGIGLSTSKKLLAAAGVNPYTRVKDLTDDEVQAIRDQIEANQVIVEGDLRRQTALDIKRLIESAATVVSDIVKAYQFVASVLKQMLEHAKVQREL